MFTPDEVYSRRACGVPMNQPGAAALIAEGTHRQIRGGTYSDRCEHLDRLLTEYSLRVWNESAKGGAYEVVDVQPESANSGGRASDPCSAHSEQRAEEGGG